MFDTLYPIVSRCSLANEIERDERWQGEGGLLERERERKRKAGRERERRRLFMAKLDTKYYLTHHIHVYLIL